MPDVGEGYKISAKVPKEFKVLESNTFTLLNEVSKRWAQELENEGINTTNLFLVISSLARTTTYQQQLIEQGYPAVGDSTHTKLGAFDIATKWFKENKPEVLEVLYRILESLQKEGRINFIAEPEIGAYHVALNPTLAN